MWHRKHDGQVLGLALHDLIGKPYRGLNGTLRYFCPIHGSDRQRSLKLNRHTGHFKCYSCGCWGYIEEINKSKSFSPGSFEIKEEKKKVTKIKVEEKFLEYHQALEGQDSEGIAVRYLKWRGIPKRFALENGIGYAGFGRWAQYNGDGKLCRQWKRGRLTFPHTNPDFEIINLYGRAIGANDVPSSRKHDNLNLPKGVFNCQGLKEDQVIITEGAFDALSLLLSGYNASAIFGVRGFNTEWIKSKKIIFGFDNDQRGQQEWKYFAEQLRQEGKEVSHLSPVVYRGYKDINELWKNERNIKIETIPYR